MKLKFDLDRISSTEFGVGRDDTGRETFSRVPVDENVQAALAEMAQDTWDAMQRLAEKPDEYEPSDKHSSQEHLYVPLDDDLAEWVKNIHEAKNLPSNVGAIEDPNWIFCYFARFKDASKRQLTAIRRAAQFKGILKNRLIRIVSDSLKLIDDDVFKLDRDFDLLIDAENVHILRPSAFEFVAKLQDAVKAAVPKNIKAIASNIAYVNLVTIGEYAKQHPRAARYLASIRGQALKGIDKNLLKRECQNNKVEVRTENGILQVADSQVMGFLEVLDRRLYGVELIPKQKERYRANSRSKVGND